MPWLDDIIIPLDLDDPRNADRRDPQGDRIRLRFNRAGGALVDFVVQYETPVEGRSESHAIVLRSDGSHAPHYDEYDYTGRKRTRPLPAHYTPVDTINSAIDDIKRNWPKMRDRFYRGLP